MDIHYVALLMFVGMNLLAFGCVYLFLHFAKKSDE